MLALSIVTDHNPQLRPRTSARGACMLPCSRKLKREKFKQFQIYAPRKICDPQIWVDADHLIKVANSLLVIPYLPRISVSIDGPLRAGRLISLIRWIFQTANHAEKNHVGLIHHSLLMVPRTLICDVYGLKQTTLAEATPRLNRTPLVGAALLNSWIAERANNVKKSSANGDFMCWFTMFEVCRE